METTQTPETKKLEINTSRQFVLGLIEQNLSIAVTTSQVGKIFFTSIQPNDQLFIFEQTLNREKYKPGVG